MPPDVFSLMFSWEIYEFFKSRHRGCSMKKDVLEKFAIFTGKLQACNFIKRNPTQVFSCEYCEVFKNTYYEEHLLTVAFLKELQNTVEQLLLY